MAVTREQIDDTGTLRIHSQEGAYVEWEFLDEDGAADASPPTSLKLYVETGFEKAVIVTAQAYVFAMTITKAEGQALRAAAIPAGQTKPRSLKWAVVDETPTVPQLLWEGVVEFEGW